MKTKILTKLIFTAGLALMLGACGGPPPAAPRGGPEVVAGGAVFQYRNSDAKTVHLVGDFNAWSPMSDPMGDKNGDGLWTLFYPLEPGRYAYKFIVDGKKWLGDPTNPISEPDGFDSQNSIVVISAPDSDG